MHGVHADLADVSGDLIGRRVLKPCPAYELVALDQMTGSERAGLQPFQQGAKIYGIMRPREPGLKVLAVDVSTADLYHAVSTVGGLAGSDWTQRDCVTVERLVMDRVLEVQADGSFVTGLAAYAKLHPMPYVTSGGGHIAELSLDAVRYAQGLLLCDSTALSRRLYGYNRLPLSPDWRRRLPSADAVAAFLDVQVSGYIGRRLKDKWIELADRQWLHWRSRYSASHDQRRHKLYISPVPDQLPETFATAVRVFGDMNVPAFKVARTTAGILRPDKLVAYFDRSTDMHAVGAQLASALHGIAVQGVPFTGTDDPAGLLSWGVDPPPGSTRLRHQPTSWRQWVTDRLAGALMVAGHSLASGREPWEFALRRVALAGVDIATWQPTENWSPCGDSGETDGEH